MRQMLTLRKAFSRNLPLARQAIAALLIDLVNQDETCLLKTNSISLDGTSEQIEWNRDEKNRKKQI